MTELIRDINMLISKPEILAQLAEECSEMAQAALKLRRTMIDTNPTPVSYEEALSQLCEEHDDVILCLMTFFYGTFKEMPLDIDENTLVYRKAKRWLSRLENHIRR